MCVWGEGKSEYVYLLNSIFYSNNNINTDILYYYRQPIRKIKLYFVRGGDGWEQKDIFHIAQHQQAISKTTRLFHILHPSYKLYSLLLMGRYMYIRFLKWTLQSLYHKQFLLNNSNSIYITFYVTWHLKGY